MTTKPTSIDTSDPICPESGHATVEEIANLKEQERVIEVWLDCIGIAKVNGEEPWVPIIKALVAAREQGAREMRESAADFASDYVSHTAGTLLEFRTALAEAIRTLPLDTPPAPQSERGE